MDKDIVERKEQIRSIYKGIDKKLLTKIPAKPEDKLKTRRVAVYARVSTELEKQTGSLELQKKHYEDLIADNEHWIWAGTYSDEGITGTMLKHRDGFNRLLEDCRNGKIDLIITKNVARFSRNIVDCIKVVRELAEMKNPVEVFFETEGIRTFDKTSEMMLSILAAVAQEESHIKSITMNTSYEQRFSKGIFLIGELYGYRKGADGNYVIYEYEADIVRLCFYLRLAGYSAKRIAKKLMELGIKTYRGNDHWYYTQIQKMFQNEKYIGDFLAFKVYTPDYLNHKSVKNSKQEHSQYLQRQHHEAIIDRDVFRTIKYMMDKSNRSRRIEYVPALRAVRTGILKGFVTIDLNYKGFSFEEYHNAAFEIEGQLGEEKKSSQLQSYLNILGRNYMPVMVIFENRIAFNSGCAILFAEVEYIEIMVSITQLKVAIRPTKKETPGSFYWRRNEKRRVESGYFADILYKMLNAQTKTKYVVPGEMVENHGEKLLFFDLIQAEAGKRVDSLKEKLLRHCYPACTTEELLMSDFYQISEIVPGTELITQEKIDFVIKDLKRIQEKLGIKEDLWNNRILIE